ncbi:MAG: hypothetical protein Q7S65_05690 [Nanoarchaeota archaeon]|nr:hypothetical protein [Nanoarchaeota archaeon]
MRRAVGSDTRFLELRRLLDSLQQDYRLSSSELVALAQGIRVPPTVLALGLSPLEAVATYLVEERQLSITTVARLLCRSKQGIWQAVSDARRKLQKRVWPGASPHDLPVETLGKKPRSLLENLVTYLHEQRKLSFADIARLIDRNQRTVWTAYHRAREK